MKILIYEPYIYKVYGNTRYIHTIFKFLNRSKFEPVLVTPVKDDFLDLVIQEKGRYIVAHAPRRLTSYGGVISGDGIPGKLMTVLAILKYTFTLSSLIARERPDIIQCHNIRSLMTIGLSAKLRSKPCLWYIKGKLENKLLDRIGFMIADKILFQTKIKENFAYPEHIRKYSSKIDVLGNAIDLDEIIKTQKKDHHQVRQELDIHEDRINIIFLGALYQQKGLAYLIDSMAEVKKEIPDIMLYLTGDHVMKRHFGFKKELEEAIIKKGLSNNVTFTGWRKDALSVLSVMDIFVLPSLREGVPKSILEAMALGKPVVATDVGGIAETVIDGETGFVVKPMDAGGLAKAILMLAKDKELRTRFGEKAREIAFRNYSIQEHIAKLEQFYMDIVHTNNFRN